MLGMWWTHSSVKIINLLLVERHVCVANMLHLLRNSHKENEIIENLDIATQETHEIFVSLWNQ